MKRVDTHWPNVSSSHGAHAAAFGEAELADIEARYPDGLSTQEIVEIFAARGEKLSEATFRKYVQQGLLPRSVRVGRKGKHRGSQGRYPASVVRQIEAVRELVHEDPPPGLAVAVTGPAATIGDMATEVEHSLVRITVVTIGLIAIILMLLYRSVAVTGLILGFIGIALGTARAATSFAGLHLFAVSTFTGSFLTGVVLGAAEAGLKV